jgi:hypothetical protein
MILPSLNCNLFDHKCVSLQFKKPQQLKHLQDDRKYLSNPELKNAVVLGVYETHINHTVLDQFFTKELKNTFLESIGNCTVWLNQIKSLLDEEATFG